MIMHEVLRSSSHDLSVMEKIVNRRLILLCMVVATSAMLAWAGVTGGIRGRVLDESGQAVPGAQISVTDVTTGAVVGTTTDASGAFQVTGLAAHSYQVTAQRRGFAIFTQKVAVRDGQITGVQAKLALHEVVQTVMVRSGAVNGATIAPTQAEVFKSGQSIRVLDREQINALSPVAGSAQILSIAPGVNVTGFGNTGATKSTITLNGIQQGWGGFGGFTTAGDLGVTFDGIPVSDAATGLWQSNMFPQSSMINSTSVTYGPGDPVTRVNNNVGGGVEYTPLQPSTHMHFSLSQTYGSYSQENTAFELTSGLYKGWSAVLAGGHGSGDNYRKSPDGFTSPNHDYAFYGKAIKDFSRGDFQLGGYYSDSVGYRSPVIPTTTVAGVTLDGTPTGQAYSQQASGFYSAPSFASYEKHDFNQMALFWSKINLDLDSTTVLHNSVYYQRINRLHDRTNDVYSPGAKVDEWNNPYTKTYGDKLWLQKVLPFNTVDAGLSFDHTLYNTRNSFHSSALGGSNGMANIGAKIRSGYFNQDRYTLFLQDQIRPVSWLTLTPGIRYVNASVGYSNGVLNDFLFAPGVVLSSKCYLNGMITDNRVSTDPTYNPNVNTTDQGSACGSTEQRAGFEPSFNLSIRPVSWLSLYGGVSEALRTPALGGGGGMFQSVDPASYQLARAEYTQAGVKAHFAQVGPVSNLLFGASYFHLLFKDQELDIGLGSGDSIYATAASHYNGLNWFLDANPSSNLHVFLNSTFERAQYTDWNQGGTNFTGLKVPYVPQTMLNVGAYYTIPVSENMVIQPRVWYQFTGSQTIFDNVAGTPSSQTMPTFGTVNLGANVPYKWLNFRLTALNIFNKQYNQYEWISSGGYLGGTPGYTLAYPGAPFTIFGTVSVHF